MRTCCHAHARRSHSRDLVRDHARDRARDGGWRSDLPGCAESLTSVKRTVTCSHSWSTPHLAHRITHVTSLRARSMVPRLHSACSTLHVSDCLQDRWRSAEGRRWIRVGREGGKTEGQREGQAASVCCLPVPPRTYPAIPIPTRIHCALSLVRLVLRARCVCMRASAGL